MYAHFQDFVDGYVGPFASEKELQAHVEFCAQRGDGAKFIGAVDAPPADAHVIMTPDEDRAWERLESDDLAEKLVTRLTLQEVNAAFNRAGYLGEQFVAVMYECRGNPDKRLAVYRTTFRNDEGAYEEGKALVWWDKDAQNFRGDF